MGPAVLAVTSVAQAPTASAAGSGRPGVPLTGWVGMPRQAVLAPGGGSVEMPRVLGARLTALDTSVTAGSSLRVSWDRRLYSVGPDPVLRTPRRTLKVSGGPVVSDPASQRDHMTVTLDEPLPRGLMHDLVLGSLTPRLYPDDLVADPLPLTLALVSPEGVERGALELSRRGEGSRGTPWGAELGAAWRPVHWTQDYFALHPALVTVLSVGPGSVPAGSAVVVTLDRRVHTTIHTGSAVTPAGAEVPGRWKRTSSGNLTVVTWTSSAPIGPGERVTLGITAEEPESPGRLTYLEPPLVEFLAAPGGGPSQRLTGAESETRHDSVYSPATLAEFGPP